ncbi:MAG: carbohydrate binding family 9 domain-containing protein [Candidatus Latescibacteria bacterium]|nr:carbohydrate binding family 9 domain-containing protein [Candidatus Latescibacterota bacterium]
MGCQRRGRRWSIRHTSACLLVCSCVTVGLFQTAGAQGGASGAASPYRVIARHVKAGPDVDGALTDSVWTSIPAGITQFIQQRPDEGQPSTQRTAVQVLYDDKNLYFGILCYDTEPAGVVANEMRRDADLTDDDFLEIILDTFHDRQNGFLFATNPAGAQFDAQVRNEGGGVQRGFRGPNGRPLTSENYNVDWDGVWITRSHIRPDGWSVEMAIPFNTIRYKRGEDVTFGLNLQRQVRRRNEQSFWTPVPRPYTIFKLSNAGELAGIRLPEPKRNLRLKPYLITGAQNDFTRTDAHRNDGKLEGGGDLKYGLTSNLILDLTYNTDFSQVESDEDQVNLTRFSLFFPEKREFLLENAGLFSFGSVNVGPSREMEMFFSRRIGLFDVKRGDTREVPIIGGARSTGKAGRYNIGFMNITTDETRFQASATADTLVPRTNFTVARVTRDILKKSNIGVSLMNKQAGLDNRYNRILSADMNLSIGNTFTANGFLSRSFTVSDRPHPDGDAFAGQFFAQWQNPLLQVSGGYRDIPADFNDELGFLPRTGIRGYRWFMGLSPEPKGSIVRRHFPHIGSGEYITDAQNRQLSRREHYGYQPIFRDGSQMEIAFNRQFERVDRASSILGVPILPGRYTFSEFFGMFFSNQSKPVFGNVRVNLGQFYDGDRRQLQLTGGLRFGSTLTIQPRYELNDVSLPLTAGRSAGDARVHLVSTRVVYSFSPRLSARTFVQWNSFDKEINTNFRIRFITTPGSDMFLVYNERRVTDDATYLTTRIDGLGVKDRTLAVKFNYLFEL